MATDQATADYQYEQSRREALDDSRAEWTDDQSPWPDQPAIAPVCAQRVNWRAARKLHLADGSTVCSSGFCTLRAVADLQQMSQTYANQCDFFLQNIPF